MVQLQTAYQMVSLPGLIMADISRIREKDKLFKDVKKRLAKNYTMKKLGSLQKKYIKSPEKFRAELELLIGSFVRDYSLLREAYRNLLVAIIETINVAEQEEYEELLSSQELIASIKKGVERNPSQFYFPEKGRKKFAEEFSKAMKALARQLSEDYAILKGESKMKRYAAGFFSRFISSRSAERKSMGASGRLKKEIDMLKEASLHVKDELEHGVKQDFMILLLQYVTEMEKTDKLVEETKKDIEIIIQDVMAEIEVVVQKIAPFILAIQNEKAAGKVAAVREEFVKLQAEIESWLSKEAEWSISAEAIAKSLSRTEQALLAELAGIEESGLKKVMAEVVNREMGR
ncbi:MAG: hypothetical protein AB1668_02855 [Nanoarchaeota archaeon]